nr:MAG TPA: hypothetical protein [Caudoviricetes sp.]
MIGCEIIGCPFYINGVCVEESDECIYNSDEE